MRELVEELKNLEGKAVDIWLLGSVILPIHVNDFQCWVEEIRGDIYLTIDMEIDEETIQIKVLNIKDYENFEDEFRLHMDGELDIQIVVA